MNTRVDWTFTPTVSLQLFAQPFVAAGDYRDFREFTTPGESEYDVYGEDRGTVCTLGGGRTPSIPPSPWPARPRARRRRGCWWWTTRTSTSARCAATPCCGGSTGRASALFFVWQQERSGFETLGDFRAGRDVGRLFREPARNVFLVKATYWIG